MYKGQKTCCIRQRHLVTPTKLRIEAKPRDYTYNDDGDYDFVKGRAMVT